MRHDVIDVLSWAAVFNRGLKTDEVWRYMTSKSSIEDVEDCLAKMSGVESQMVFYRIRVRPYRL